MIEALRRMARGRAFGPGLGRARVGAAAALCTAALAACGSSSHSMAFPANTLPNGKKSAIGALPRFLPQGSEVDVPLQGTIKRPALASQGDAVAVHLGSAVIQVRVTGPKTPPTGQAPEPTIIPCTWQVTMKALKGEAAGMAIGQWSIQVGDTGQVYHPSVAAGTTFPSVLAQGRSVTWTMAQTLIPGEGLVRWAPSNNLLSSWDYIAEID